MEKNNYEMPISLQLKLVGAFFAATMLGVFGMAAVALHEREACEGSLSEPETVSSESLKADSPEP
jgi:hypothetical protein